MTVTHCPQGHEYSPDNLYPHRKGWKVCKACAAQRRRMKAEGCFTTKPRTKTHCKRGHALVGVNVYVSPKGSRECKQCRRDANARYVKKAVLTEGEVRKLIDGLHEGKTLNNLVVGQIGRQGLVKGLRVVGNPRVFYNTMRVNPRLKRIVYKIAKKNAHIAQSEGARNQRIVAAGPIMRDEGRFAYDVIQNATRHLSEPLRGVVQSDMFLALAEGRLKPRDVSGRVQEFVRRYYRDEKHAVDSRWGHRSLDAPIGEDGFTLMDTIADMGAWSPVAINTGRML